MSEVKAKSKVMINTKNLVITGMFTAIICVLSQVQIPIGTIPFSLGLFAVFLTGALLEPRFALLSVMAYLLLGAVGLPVFANFKGGIQALFGPTGGYLLSYPLVAFIISLFNSRIKKYRLAILTFAMMLSLLLCYVLGTIWFSYVTGNSFISALSICVFPFILFDLAKIALSVSLSMVIRKAVSKNMY